MTAYDTVLLAGDRRGAKSVFGKNKAFLEVKGIPSFIRVITALQKVKAVNEIRVVGPADEIRTLLEKHADAWSGPKNVKVLPQKDNIIENVWTAFIDSLPDYQEGKEAPAEQKEKAVLVVAGDVPLLIPDEINEFISNCDTSRFDYYVGVVSDKTLSFFAPKKGRVGGVRLAFLPMKEINCRINNLHLLKPFKISNKYRIEDMYEHRYQRKLRNVLIFFLKIVRLEGVKSAALFYIAIQATLFFQRIGMIYISKMISSFLTIARFESIVGRILGTKISIAETTCGGAVLDIDSEADFKVINERFEEWMECQKGRYPLE